MNTLLSRIIWFVPIFISTLLAEIEIINQLRTPDIDQVWKSVLISLAGMIIVLIFCTAFFIMFHYERTNRLLGDEENKKEIRKAPYIFKRIKGILEYLDTDGHEMSYRVSEHITHIKQFRPIVSDFEVQGEITNISVINNNVEPISPNKLLLHKNINRDTLVNNEFFSDFALVIKDGFQQDAEFWKIAIKSYCKFFELEIVIPAGRRLLESKLFHVKVTNEIEKGKIFRLKDMSPMTEYGKNCKMIIRRQNATVICLQLTGITSKDLFMLKWTLSPATS